MFDVLRHRLLLQMALAFAFGLVLNAYFSLWTIVPIGIVLGSICLKKRVWITFLILFVLLGSVRWSLEERTAPNDITLFPLSNQVTLTGKIASEPVSKSEGRVSIRFNFAVQTVNGSSASGTVLVRVFNPSLTPQNGQTLELTGALEEPEGIRAPGGVDYKGYLHLQGIERIFTVKGEKNLVVLNAQTGWIARLTTRFRSSFQSIMGRLLPPDQAALLGGLILGIQSEMPDEIKEQMQITGTYHLLSVSGSHVYILSLLIFYLSRLIGLSKQQSALMLIILVTSYAVLVGGQPPTVRASLMAGIVSAAFLVKREPDYLSAYGAAGFIILLWQPRMLFDMGFQLSFATIGVILLWTTPFARRIAPHLLEPKENLTRVNILKRYILFTLIGSVVAQIGSTPLVAYYFNSFSVIAPLPNLLLSVITFGIFMVVLPLWLAGVIWLPFALWFAPLLRLPVTFFMEIIQIFSQIPLASVNVPSFSWGWLALFYLLLLALAKEPDERVL